jgi:F0F1-type ATP synthase alpha subunit
MRRPEIDATLDEYAKACREVGAEQHKPPGRCDLHYLSDLLGRAAKVRNRLHEQIDEIAADAVAAGMER